jgi:hypothetical protein
MNAISPAANRKFNHFLGFITVFLSYPVSPEALCALAYTWSAKPSQAFKVAKCK